MAFASGNPSGRGGTINAPSGGTVRRTATSTSTAPRTRELVFGMGGDGLYTGPEAYPQPTSSYHPTQYSGAQIPEAPQPAPPIPFTNTAPNDPNFSWLIEQMKSRATGPGASDAAITQMGQRLREFGAGQAQARAGDLARRGLLQGGSGSEGSLSAADTDRLNSQFAQNAAGIALGRQGQIDQLLSGMANPMGMSANQNLAERQFGVNQYQAQAGVDLQRQALQQQAQSQAWQQQIQAQQLAMQQQAAMTQAYNSLYR